MRCGGWILIVLSAGAAAQSERTLSAQARDMLAAHNQVRARAGVLPLIWSSRLEAQAQDWANRLLARRQFSHRPNAAVGENLFEIHGAAALPRQVVQEWAAESRNYDSLSNRCRGICGHYTQIVWRDTKEVGCAVARGAGREIWVCNYDPPGNWRGERPY